MIINTVNRCTCCGAKPLPFATLPNCRCGVIGDTGYGRGMIDRNTCDRCSRCPEHCKCPPPFVSIYTATQRRFIDGLMDRHQFGPFDWDARPSELDAVAVWMGVGRCSECEFAKRTEAGRCWCCDGSGKVDVWLPLGVAGWC